MGLTLGFISYKNEIWKKMHILIGGIELCHYANLSMKYTAIFHGCKNVNFQMKNYNIFLIFVQNMDCRYTLEPPQ